MQKLTLSLPVALLEQINFIVQREGRWTSDLEFIRWAVVSEIDRWKAAGHRLPEGPGPADLLGEVKQERRRAP